MNSSSIVVYAGVLICASYMQSALASAAGGELAVYSFGSHADDGEVPNEGLIDVKGKLYGMTYGGGAHGYGTVYSLNPKNSVETVLYSFCAEQSCLDGMQPLGNLISVNGLLYGTTKLGGAYGYGTVFSVNPKTGAEAVIHSFGEGTDGSQPGAGLIEVNSTLYGTTTGGGLYADGAVFSVDPATESESLIYSFCGSVNCPDGHDPAAPLLNVNGTLYGTTESGGLHNSGTVFALNPATGAEAVVYSFCYLANCADGIDPEAGLIDVSGMLYGTTNGGGAGGLFGGTVFAVNPKNGKETVVHSFPFCDEQGCPDGDEPTDSLIEVKGILYGTTYNGGANEFYAGTVFSLDPKTRMENVIYSFCAQQNCADGDEPVANLVNVKGVLYGTATGGGSHNLGVVFSLTR